MLPSETHGEEAYRVGHPRSPASSTASMSMTVSLEIGTPPSLEASTEASLVDSMTDQKPFEASNQSAFGEPHLDDGKNYTTTPSLPLLRIPEVEWVPGLSYTTSPWCSSSSNSTYSTQSNGSRTGPHLISNRDRSLSVAILPEWESAPTAPYWSHGKESAEYVDGIFECYETPFSVPTQKPPAIHTSIRVSDDTEPSVGTRSLPTLSNPLAPLQRPHHKFPPTLDCPSLASNLTSSSAPLSRTHPLKVETSFPGASSSGPQTSPTKSKALRTSQSDGNTLTASNYSTNTTSFKAVNIPGNSKSRTFGEGLKISVSASQDGIAPVKQLNMESVAASTPSIYHESFPTTVTPSPKSSLDLLAHDRARQKSSDGAQRLAGDTGTEPTTSCQQQPELDACISTGEIKCDTNIVTLSSNLGDSSTAKIPHLYVHFAFHRFHSNCCIDSDGLPSPSDFKSQYQSQSSLATHESQSTTSNSSNGFETDSEDEVESEGSSNYEVYGLLDILGTFLDEHYSRDIKQSNALVKPVLTPMKQAMVERVMAEFWIIFNQEWPSIGRKCATASSTPQPSASQYNWSSEKTVMNRHGKRDRENTDNQNSDDDDRKDPRRPKKMKSQPEDRPDHVGNFACPYRKYNPQEYCLRK